MRLPNISNPQNTSGQLCGPSDSVCVRTGPWMSGDNFVLLPGRVLKIFHISSNVCPSAMEVLLATEMAPVFSRLTGHGAVWRIRRRRQLLFEPARAARARATSRGKLFSLFIRGRRICEKGVGFYAMSCEPICRVVLVWSQSQSCGLSQSGTGWRPVQGSRKCSGPATSQEKRLTVICGAALHYRWELDCTRELNCARELNDHH